jgi:hypothetical protein
MICGDSTLDHDADAEGTRYDDNHVTEINAES